MGVAKIRNLIMEIRQHHNRLQVAKHMVEREAKKRDNL
jgi:hypothetical protein